ncbi:MAG: hypothetical protein AAFX81_10245 [Pseudomonadota bacterium]
MRLPSLWTIARLLVLSFLVGLVLAWLGLTPGQMVARVLDFGRAIWMTVVGLIDQPADIVRLILLGAVVVVPLWLLGAVWQALRRRR